MYRIMGKCYGLLIGVTYPNTSSYLPGCDNDILEVYKFLKGSGYNEVDILCDTDIFEQNSVSVVTSIPTYRNIVYSLFKMIYWARNNPSGKIFLHYSGHGTQVSDNNWVFDRELRKWRKEEDDGSLLKLGEKISGITAMGIISFPAGPGKIKFGAGLVGSSPGFSMEASYGIRIGEMVEVRGGIRSTEALNAKTSASNELGRTGWMDGQIVLGVNL